MNKRAELKKQFLKGKDITVKSQKQESKLSLEADLTFFTEDRQVEYKYIRET